ncbi:MAG: hypothetical protein CMN21_19980 [Rubinisphaera sp.]|nr:hypothetical protein [Rubinisphaera sp.]
MVDSLLNPKVLLKTGRTSFQPERVGWRGRSALAEAPGLLRLGGFSARPLPPPFDIDCDIARQAGSLSYFITAPFSSQDTQFSSRMRVSLLFGMTHLRKFFDVCTLDIPPKAQYIG